MCKIMELIEVFDELYEKYKNSITNISKTENNNFIIFDINLIDFDDVAKDYATKSNMPELSSVDAIDYKIVNNKLILYFYEFKKIDLLDRNILAKNRLNDLFLEMKTFNDVPYVDELKDIKKGLLNKILVSLKIKPIESLFLLHRLIENKELIDIEKHYYIVSQTPISFSYPLYSNKSNSRRKRRSKEIFDFIDKLSPFPFKQTGAIKEKMFLELVS